ncbi:hypothetical protein C5O00_06970 [Pukyongia salina]|uniref:KAP NTPase domain-containing protein n=1 Tax=Pukyongia salina TaxID=2094025 RepID=A0A2S0HWC4_9FLAO|nr:P-loop NTPase fold protein [Pukyongia salina]AVI50930.1 hypothetical protein C5O00_06970 [Pukyongia salina]
MGTPPPELSINYELIQQILNYEFDLGLLKDIRVQNSSGSKQIDFLDDDRRAAAEIQSGYNTRIRGNIVKNLKSTRSLLRLHFQQRYRFILVVLNELTDNDRGFLQNELKTSGEIEQIILDLNDLKRLAAKFKFDGEFFIQRNIKTEYEEEVYVSNNPLNILLLRLENNNLFLGGHLWGANQDQTERFLADAIWENGHETNDTNAVNSVKEGDLVFLKSTYQSKGKSFLRIKGVGYVTKNYMDGHKLGINWNLFNSNIDIEGLGKYRRTFQRVMPTDRNMLLDKILDEVPDFLARIEQFQSIFTPSITSVNQVPIDSANKIYVGLEVGEEIKEYDVIFLPKSSYGPIGKNGIASHILNILGADREAFRFSDHDLKELNYKWDDTDLPDKRVELGFIVTKGEDKNDFNFRENLQAAVNNFPGPIIKGGEINPPVKVFIPLLGTGQAGMSVEDSFKIIIDAIPMILNQFRNSQIRINFPRNIERESLSAYARRIIRNSTSREIPNLNEQIGLLFGEDFENEDDIFSETKDKIPFRLDQVVDEDKLGREPVAKAFVDLIKNDIFTEHLNHSFMVHLQGKWGAGKSSFLNFIKRNLNSDDEKWIIVEYNAWQNQHIRPPWWSLIDQVYLKSKDQLFLIGIRTSLHLRRKELFRRIWRYSGWDKITAFIVFLVSILCIIYYGEDILNIFKTTSDTGEKKSFVSNFGDFLKLILTLVSVVGTLFAFAKFITVPFFINSSKEAKSFVLRASDPMNKIKEHFNDLVDDINSKKKKRQLAIFIDDIDRCDKEFIVQLLEGIQTLFKDKRVLYIVAGDKNWISTSFGNTYRDFANEQVDREQLGEFFIEKAFQLSFRLPNISEESKQNYWNHILGMENKDEDIKISSIEELTEDKKSELQADLKESKTKLTNPVFVRGLQEKYNLSGDTASNIVIEEKNKDTEELKHLLHEYHKYIDTNPRSIIRLANNYTMARSILMAERVTFDEHKLFRWLVIEDLCPKVKSMLPNAEHLSSVEEMVKSSSDVLKRDKCLQLLEGEADFMGGKIEIEEIKTIKGF